LILHRPPCAKVRGRRNISLSGGALPYRREDRMAVSVVNGYVCTSSCDVAKAKKGEDPHPAIRAANGEPQDGAVDRGPAVLFGGSLSGARGAEGVQPPDASATSDPANGWTRKLGVDRLA
jgi:hypothetical protein